MNVDLSALPTDVDALTALVRELVSELKTKELLNAQLEARIAKLKPSCCPGTGAAGPETTKPRESPDAYKLNAR